MNRPSSWDESLMTEWSLWSLQHGLPVLPSGVEKGESVPIARWVGPKLGAVMHVQWSWSDDEPEDDEIDNEIELFWRRSDGSWEPSLGSGGSNWHLPPFERPAGMNETDAYFGGEVGTGGDGWYGCGIDGIAGAAAATVEVENEIDGLVTMPLESPFGAFVVATAARSSATIRVREADGSVMAELEFPGWTWAPN